MKERKNKHSKSETIDPVPFFGSFVSKTIGVIQNLSQI